MTVKNLQTGETFDKAANVVISARGSLNEISWPQISGLWDFKGKIMHSADWDERCVSCISGGSGADSVRYDLRHKRVGVIGNGSSAIQIVPNVRKLDGVNMWCFARSPTWISPTFGDMAMMKLGLDPADSTCT